MAPRLDRALTRIAVKHPCVRLRLSVENYEDVISRYHHVPDQKRYERNILRNIPMAYALLGHDDAPTDFADAGEAFDRLNGCIFLR